MKGKKILSVILVLAMVFSVLPQFSLRVFAAGGPSTIDVSDTVNMPSSVTYSGGVFTINDNSVSPITVTGTGSNTIAVASVVTGLTLILNNVSITSPSGGNSPLDLLGTASVTLQLADGTTNIMSAANASQRAGIHAASGTTLTINGTGSLLAQGCSLVSNGGAGIGGYPGSATAGNITINSGTINTFGGYGAAGIGGGPSGAGGTITINGGTVTATGGSGVNSGAGIGGGIARGGGTINIGGTAIVTATGGNFSAGIGGGGTTGSNGGTISIGGTATVTATGGYGVDNNGGGAGIGGGRGDLSASLTITGTPVITAASYAGSSGKPAIDASSGSGSVINAKLNSAISAIADTYLQCSGNTLKLPAKYQSFAFSADSASAVGAYSNSGCTASLGSVVTDPAGVANIPVTDLGISPTNVTPVKLLPEFTATVTVAKDGSNWTSGTPNIQLSTSNTALQSALTGTLSNGVYTFTGLNAATTYYVWDTTNNQYTSKTLVSASPNPVINYYTVQFAVSNAGAASGSTISGAYNSAAISTGDIVLGGKQLVITAVGNGASGYTYAWSGAGTSGQTTASLTIASLGTVVNATCTVTGLSSTTINVGVSSGVNLPTGVTYAGNLFTIGTGANNSTISVIGTTATNTIAVANGVTGLTLIVNDVSITSTNKAPIDLQGTASVIIELADGATNILNASGSANKPALCVPSGATVIIQNDTMGTGRLNATGGQYCAGIGGYLNGSGGNITINGGTVTADSGFGAAGIGGGNGASSGAITINGGTVNATGNYTGAGIGGGVNGAGGNITITGGTITAVGGTSGAGGAGIGGGYNGAGGVITISGTPTILAVSEFGKPAINAVSGSGRVINAKLNNPISTTVDSYLRCNGNTLKLPAYYYNFAFSTAADSAVSVYSDPSCTTFLGSVVTNPAGISAIPVTNLSTNPANVTAVQLYTASVSVTKDGSNWMSGAPNIQLSTSNTALQGAVTGTFSFGVYTFNGLNAATTYYVWDTTNNQYTNKSIISTSSSPLVSYYTVQFAVSNAGTASGSTISASYNSVAISTGDVVLGGKQLIITAVGQGASNYTYAWSGAGTSGQTIATLTIASIGAAVNATCTITGAPATYTATVNLKKDTSLWTSSGKIITLQQASETPTATSEAGGVFTANVTNGTWKILIGGVNTGLTVVINNAAASQDLNYYTVQFAVIDQGTASGSTISATYNSSAISTGAVVLGGSQLVITAVGQGSNNYTYGWSGTGTSGELTAGLTILSLNTAVNATCIVNSKAPKIITASLPDGTAGTAYSQNLSAIIVGSPTWDIESGSLPTGLSLNASTGVITGTPTTVGSSSFTVKITTAFGNDTKALSITINGIAPTITTASLPNGTIGVAYSQTLAATGTATITWSVESGALPAGLTLNASTGVIAGTPSAIGSSNFTLKASNGISPDATKALSITINGIAPSITTASLPNGTIGTAYSQTLTATGTTPITWSIESGSLPAGLTLNTSTGAIDGTPTAIGSSSFTVKASNGYSPDATKALSITINGIAPSITTASLPNGTIGVPYSQTLSATGTAPIAWSITAGGLPIGLDISSNTGIISGTPTVAGASTFTVQAVNSTGSETKTYTVTVAVNTYALTVNLNGGNGATASGTYASGAVVSIDAGARSGYTFIGWTSSNGGAFSNAGSTATTFTMPGNATTITANWAQNNNGAGGGGSNTPSENNNTTIIVGGKDYSIGTENQNGSSTTSTVDQGKLTDGIEKASESSSVIFPVSPNTNVTAQLVVKNVEDMAKKDMTLTIQTGNVSYNLTTSAIDTASIISSLGTPDSKDIPFSVSIINSSVVVKGATVVVSPVEFTITATYNGKTVGIDTFSCFVNRTIEITAEQANKITTAVVIEPDGSLRHIPTKVTVVDGKYCVVINSLTNSIYSVISNPLKFADITNHWAKDEINDMGSRMVVNGVGNGKYDPDRDITRAEFAAILVRALGLKPGIGTNPFADVKTADWYCSYIMTASQYGLIYGYGKDKFGPQDKITREQAMTMIARAMKITGSNVTLSSEELNTAISMFSDAGQVSDYAKGSIAQCINTGIVNGKGAKTIAPKDNISRAEVAVIVRRLLRNSKLI